MKKVFFNAKVYVEKGVYAQAVLAEDGIIRAVGTDEEVLAESQRLIAENREAYEVLAK